MWFLYWICYDVFVWNKALTQTRPENYIGLVQSIGLAILSTQLGKLGILEKFMLIPKPSIHKNQQGQRGQQVLPLEEEIKPMSKDSEVRTGCRFHLGYLYARSDSVEIPEDCLECEDVANCLSPTARTI